MPGLESIQDLEGLRLLLEKETFTEDKKRMRICTGTACLASGAKQVAEMIETQIKEEGVDLEVVKTGCQGLCQKGPLIQLEPSGYFYQRVKPADSPSIVVNASSSSAPPIRHLLYKDPVTSQHYERLDSIDFYKKQLSLIHI